MSREVMKLAFTELQNARDYIYLLAESKQPLTEEEMLNQINAAITALRQALETERNDLAKVGEVGVWGDIKPVAWMHTTAAGLVYFRKKPQDKVFNPQPVYTAPPKREWVGLTDEEREHFRGLGFVGVLAIEAKLKEKNI